MKIALVIDQFDALDNGTTISARRFIENLRKHGHTVKVVSTGAPEPDKFVVKDRHIPIVSRIAKKQGMVFGYPDEDILREAFKDADLVHFMLPNALAKCGRKIADELKLPKIAAFHMQPESITYALGLGKVKFVNDFIYKHLNKKFYRYFDDIHCPTKFIAGELERNHYKTRFHIISNGVDSAFQPLQLRRNKQLKNKITILMVGRYAKEKRQDVLIKAVYKSHYQNRIQLIFAGHGPLENRYRKLSRWLPIKPVFGFYSKNELIKMINASDLYVHTSDAEIEAISCIEAFACGTVPIIANAEKSATKQFALDDRSLFKAGDPVDLAKKIDYLIEHDGERAELREKYIELGRQYNVEKSVTAIEAVYEELIAKKKIAVSMSTSPEATHR